MNTNEKRQKIIALQRELETLRQQVDQETRNCHHRWPDEATYDPIESPRMEFSHYEGHGSDPNPIYRKAGTTSKPRWKRVCLDCGKIEYTEKKKTVQTAPDFGR